MKISYMIFASFATLALGTVGLSATAGSIADTDSDLIPDVFDNCSSSPNGPGTANECNQVDTDADGFGNTCDADFDNDNVVAGTDFTVLLGAFGGSNAETDLDCDGVVAGTDFSRLLSLFGTAPGPGNTAI